MFNRGVSSLVALAACPSLLPAQPPVFVPMSNTTLSTSASLHFSSIFVPPGVTVQFTGTAPAIVQCDGDCIVQGTLSAAAVGSTDGPGAVTSGSGALGAACLPFCTAFGCLCWGHSILPGPGVHHGVYGTAIPFSLDGGSPGGAVVIRNHSNPFASACCDVAGGVAPGGGGGGTLVVLADGRIDIGGVVDVRGGSNGSAGSLLLRGAGGTIVRPTGQLLAGPLGASGGEVRLDAWGGPPLVQGSIVAPAPVVLTLPHLHTAGAPAIGTTWSIEVFAPANAFVFVAAATQPAVGTPTPFGTLDIDLASGAIVGAAAAAPGHDSRATIPWTIPNLPQLVGLPLFVQGLALPPSLPPRLTNAITAVVQ